MRADKVVALAQAEVVKLRALTPPSADAKKVTKVYDAIDAGWAAVADDPELLIEGAWPTGQGDEARVGVRLRGVRPGLSRVSVRSGLRRRRQQTPGGARFRAAPMQPHYVAPR